MTSESLKSAMSECATDRVLGGGGCKGVNIKLKGTYCCPIEIIKGLSDKGQFQYLVKFKGPQVGNYLYTTQFPSLR